MAVIPRPDGLYDIPEMNLQGVPANLIPPQLMQQAPPANDLYNAVPPVPGNDLALAQAGGAPAQGGNVGSYQPPPVPANTPPPPQDTPWVADVGPNYVPAPMYNGGAGGGANQAAPYLANAASPNNPQGPPPPQEAPAAAPVANPADLHGPEGASGEAGGRSPLDEDWAAYLKNSSKGTPGTVVKGGPTLTSETWHTHDITAKPGFSPVIVEDPVTGLPVRKMVSNEILFKAEESKQHEAEADLEAAVQGSESRKAGRELYMGRRLGEAADREAGYVKHLEEQTARNEKLIADHDAATQKILSDLQTMATRTPPDGAMRAKFTTGLAQGLLYAGAAAAGQQVPHVDWIGQEINRNIEQQRMQMEAGLHVAGLRLNALSQLRQQFQSPEAAEHALAAANWAQAQHELEALTHRAQGGQIKDNAQILWHQMDVKKAEEVKMSFGAEHDALINNLPDRVVPGQQGGIPGRIEAIKRALKGAPKETIEAAINKELQSIKEGKPSTFPGGPGEKHDRGTTAYTREVMGRQFQIHPDFGTGVVYAPTEKEGEEARAAMSSYHVLKTLLTKALKISDSAPDRLSPTGREALKNTLMGAQNVYRTGMQMGVYKESEAPLLETETGAEVLLKLGTLADRKKVIEGVLQNLHHQAESHIKLFQATTNPEVGAPYYQEAGQVQGRKPE